MEKAFNNVCEICGSPKELVPGGTRKDGTKYNSFMGCTKWKSHPQASPKPQKITQLLEEKERQARTQLLSEIVEKMPKGRDMYKAKDFDGINNENLRRWNLIRTGYNDCIADILNIIKEIEHE